MRLTALDIKQQTFDKSFRGYDESEVKAYLSLVSNEWEHLVSRQKEMEKEIKQLRQKMEQYDRVQEALHETLQTAKDSAEQKLERARSDARDKIEKAEIEADQIISEARGQRQEIRQSILRLLDRRKEIIGGIRNYLDLAQESLQQFADDDNQIFSLPNDDIDEKKSDVEKKLEMRKKASQSANEEHQTESDSDHLYDESEHHEPKGNDLKKRHIIPGAEDLDDIIDDID